jgi:hypothetical protein
LTVVREIIEEPPWSAVVAAFERDPLTALIESQDGVVARSQARGHLSEKAIRHRIESGRWRRVHRGIYNTHGGPVRPSQHLWIALLAAGTGSSTQDSSACLGGVSALHVHGLRGIAADRVHVVVAPNRQVRAPRGVAIHRVRLVDEDRHTVARPPATAVGRSVIDAAAWARSDEEARLVIAASFQQRLVTAAEIGHVLDRLPMTNRRRLVISTVRDADGGSHSIGELWLVSVCRSGGLPMPTRQGRFRDASGRVRYFDAVYDQWRVAVEVDGAHHGGIAQRWDDAGRQNEMVLAGFRVLRFPVHVVREQPHHVAATIRAALELAGWRPEDG